MNRSVAFKSLGLVVAILVALLYLPNRDSQEEVIQAPENVVSSVAQNPEKNHVSSDGAPQAANRILKTKSALKPYEQPSKKLISKQAAAKAFIDNVTFDSEQAVNDLFLLSDDIVSKQTLQYSFLAQNFHELMSKIKEADKGELAIGRELALTEKLYDKFGSKIYEDTYACSGKICVLSFKYDSLSEEEMRDLETFGRHYSFKNLSRNEQGESIYKGMFIATNDPSNLKIK